MIDSRIPLMTQAIDMNVMLENGSKQTELFTKMRTDGELARIYREASGDLGKMAELGKQSKYAQLVMPNIQSQVAAQEKAMYDRLKTEAEISKIGSEAYKNNQQGGGYALDNSGKKLGAIQGAFQQASLTGDKAQVLLGLNGLVRTEMMTPEEYQHQAAIVNTMTPDELKQYAGGINFANAKDPAALQYQSADNAADNAQSDINNQRTTNASIYSTDVSAKTADKNRVQNQQQFEANFEYKAQQDEIKNGQGEVKEFGGKAYIAYKDGTARQLVDQQGRPVVAGKVEAQKDRLERISAAQDYANSAQTASEAAKLAAELANDRKGLNSAAGGFGLMAKVPGSDAKTFASKLETLKSNVFLGQVSLMKGMGALTDAEGARLEKSIAALDLPLSPQELQQNLTHITKTMSRAAKSASQKAQLFGGVNTTGTQGPTRQATQNAVNAVSFFD